MSSNIILITDVLPDKKYTAGLVLHKITENLSDIKFKIFWFNQSKLYRNSNLSSNCIIYTECGKFLWLLAGIENLFSIQKIMYILKLVIRSFKKILRQYASRDHQFLSAELRQVSALPERHKILKVIKHITSPAGLFIKFSMKIISNFFKLVYLFFLGIYLGVELAKCKEKLVWIVIQGDSSILVYYLAILFSGKKFLLHQWDPLSWWQSHHKPILAIKYLSSYLLEKMEKQAITNIVPSENWVKKLQSENKNAIQLDNFFEAETYNNGKFVYVKEKNVIHAAFLGQLYASSELIEIVNCLAGILVRWNFRLVLHCYGNAKLEGVKSCQVYNHGFLDHDDLIFAVQKWDVALLPYLTQQVHKEASSLSFPSKSRMYLAAGLPIISLTPLYSSVDSFMKKYYTDYYFNIYDKNNLESFISSLINETYDEKMRRRECAKNVIIEKMSASVELMALKNLLGEIL